MNKYFLNTDGVKIQAITANQMIEVDRIAVEETGPNLFQMMENAGRNLALTIMDIVSSISNPKVIVLAGTGGNGGGGIVAARHLLNRNINVKLAITDKYKMKGISNFQFQLFKNAGGFDIDKVDDENYDIIVDSIIGYSLVNHLHGRALEFVQWANKQDANKISLDVPTGLNSTTGEISGEYFEANTTMTLALPKTGLTEDVCGEILLADIGIPKTVYDKIGIQYISPFLNEFIIPIRSV